MTNEERVWKALDKPRSSKQVWEQTIKDDNPRISWQAVEEALKYWLDTGMVRVTNKRFWRCPPSALKKLASSATYNSKT